MNGSLRQLRIAEKARDAARLEYQRTLAAVRLARIEYWQAIVKRRFARFHGADAVQLWAGGKTISHIARRYRVTGGTVIGALREIMPASHRHKIIAALRRRAAHGNQNARKDGS
jgi:hypothetical protein